MTRGFREDRLELYPRGTKRRGTAEKFEIGPIRFQLERKMQPKRWSKRWRRNSLRAYAIFPAFGRLAPSPIATSEPEKTRGKKFLDE